MHFVPQPPSSYSDDPPNDIILCSSISDSTLVVNEDQAINGVGVAQPTCIVIHEEYDLESENQPEVKDDSLLSTPPLFLPDIFGDSSIPDFTCVYLFANALIIDHSQDSLDVSLSSVKKRTIYSLKIHLIFNLLFSKE